MANQHRNHVITTKRAPELQALGHPSWDFLGDDLL